MRSLAPQLTGPLKGWTGYFNKHAGYVRASKSLEKAYKACLELGVKFITGKNGHAIHLMYAKDGSTTCTGVKTVNGTIHSATRIILCLGAHGGRLLSSLTQQITAKSWAVAHLQLTAEEAASFEGMSVINCRDLGFFFEPDLDTLLIKLCAHGAGYTNRAPPKRSTLSSIFVGLQNLCHRLLNFVRTWKWEEIPNAAFSCIPSLPPSDARENVGIPAEDEKLIRRLIDEAIPQFVDRELVNKFVCWCGDTADSEYIIDHVPNTPNLIVATGDSGHAFKMLPIAGEWVVRLLEDGVQNIPRWRWKDTVQRDVTDISWRVGTVKDIKDVGPRV